jgi:hypothetical protein
MDTNHTHYELAAQSLSWGNSDSEKGEVFTDPEVVLFMLKAIGIEDSILNDKTRILEPSCGQGEFVTSIAKLLLLKLADINQPNIIKATFFTSLISAFDVSSSNIIVAKKNTAAVLSQYFSKFEADMLVNCWYKNEDFLLTKSISPVTHVIGNPPYVRIENIPKNLLEAYRKDSSAMKERADLYIAFYEKALSLLQKKGSLSFLCTDRWTKNKYGNQLRSIIHEEYSLDLFIDLYGQSVFQTDVLTYPAITQISRNKGSKTLVLHNPNISSELANNVFDYLSGRRANIEAGNVRNNIVNKGAPWLFNSKDEIELIKRLETEFPTIEDTGNKVYIGAATGHNEAFIIDDNVNVEADRKLPVIKAENIINGNINCSNKYLINTYDENGLINLSNYPRLEEHLLSFEDALKKRHVAKKHPQNWFKTIDRVYPERAYAKKLLIPDIKSKIVVAYDDGKFHPNNSIYYICSEYWDLKALKAILISGLGQFFVEAYSTKVSGGNLRFQAQHLRRIRVPFWKNIDDKTKIALRNAGQNEDIMEAKKLVEKIYKLSEKEAQIIGL